MGRPETYEHRQEVRPFRVLLMCKCGGEMTPTGLMLASNPPQYPHKCEWGCGATVNERRTYPYIDYEVIGA